MLELRLKKDLRKNLLRGHPWLYDGAIECLGPSKKQSEFCRILDQKKNFLAYGIYTPKSQLAVRVFSFNKKGNFAELIEERARTAMSLRASLIPSDATNAYRLFNGEGDLLPGLVCDVYGDTAVLQMDGTSLQDFWLQQEGITKFLSSSFASIALKERGKEKGELKWLKSKSKPLLEVKENHIRFMVDIAAGQKTGMFLDQRDNRDYIRSIAKDKSVLNLFSYTGGFSVYAGKGEAKHVTSVDISKGACEFAEKNWLANELPKDQHKALAENVFDILEDDQHYDMIIADPPSMAQSEKQKAAAIKKYIDLFSQVAKKVKDNGDMVFSSCSSHISFADFQSIVDESLSKARCRGQVLRFSGQGADHPYPHYLPEMRYLKFMHLIKKV
tara:strand:- start:1588 stop:2745 length:1158 start_codon:yes stop_codon:yes gene_type:complete